jgi:hypothetical protein
MHLLAAVREHRNGVHGVHRHDGDLQYRGLCGRQEVPWRSVATRRVYMCCGLRVDNGAVSRVCVALQQLCSL